MEKSDIIKAYTEHIRDVSMLTDDGIRRFLEELDNQIPDSLITIEDFLEVVAKNMPIEIITNEENKERANIRKAFKNKNSVRLEDITATLKELGDRYPSKTVLNAIMDDFLQIDSIFEDNSVYFVLTERKEIVKD